MKKIWNRYSFWVLLCGAVAVFLLEFFITKEVEYSAIIIPVCLSFWSLRESTILSKKDHNLAQSLQYNDFEKEIEQEVLVSATKRWRFISEHYFTGDGIHTDEMETAFAIANERDKTLSIQKKAGIVDSYMRNILEQNRLTFDDSCKPLFDYCRRIAAAYNNDNITEQQLKELFKRPELGSLVAYGLYYLDLSMCWEYENFYRPAFLTLAKKCSIRIWDTEKACKVE